MVKEYSWRVDGFYKEDAAVVGQELETIEQQAELNAEAVVSYAKEHTESALFRMLEWDNVAAGEKWRLQQARTIIGNIRVNIIHSGEEKTKKPIRAFVQTKKMGEYKPIEVIVKDTDQYQILLEKAYKELNGVKDRYTELIEIQELLKDIPVIE